MLRRVLGSLAVGAVVGGCRMEAMDLHGPPEPEGSQASPPAETPAAQSPASQSQSQSPATQTPTTSTRPTDATGTTRRPSRSPGTTSPTSGAEGGRMTGITAAHNKARAELGLPALVWTPALAQYAQAWANKLQQRGCDLQHRPSRGADAQKYGENLYWSSGMKSTPNGVVGEWVAERKDFDIKTNRCRGVCGHYTQVVWRKSTRVGCAMATCGEAEVWVCNYDPPGNYVGERPY